MAKVTRSSEVLVTVFGLSILIGLLVAHAVYLGGSAEDSFITYRFARNVASGFGLVWNVNDAPIEGYTNFLWLFVLAASFKLGLDIVLTSQVLGVISACATLVLTFLFARRMLRVSLWAAFVPCALIASSGPMATWASSGLETSTFGLFVLGGTYCFVEFLWTGSRSRVGFSAFLLFLATLLRPEGIVVFGILVTSMIVMGWARNGLKAGAVSLFAGIFLLPVAIFFVWRFEYFGDWMPNTYYAKTGGGIHQYLRGIQYVGYFIFFFVTPLILAWVTAISHLGKSGTAGWRDWAQVRIWVDRHPAHLLCAALSIAYPMCVVYVGGDYMAMYRFMVPVIPFVYLLVALAISTLELNASNAGGRAAIAAIGLFAVGATLVHSTPLEGSLFAIAPRQHGNYRGIQAKRWHVARLTEIGRFYASRKSSPDDVVATVAIGAIGYFSEMKVDDLAGLTDRHIARVRVNDLGRGWAGHEKMDLDYSFRRLPKFMDIERSLAPVRIDEAQANKSAEAMTDALQSMSGYYPRVRRFAQWMRENAELIENHYVLRTAWMEDRVNGENGYFVYLERKPD